MTNEKLYTWFSEQSQEIMAAESADAVELIPVKESAEFALCQCQALISSRAVRYKQILAKIASID